MVNDIDMIEPADVPGECWACWARQAGKDDVISPWISGRGYTTQAAADGKWGLGMRREGKGVEQKEGGAGEIQATPKQGYFPGGNILPPQGCAHVVPVGRWAQISTLVEFTTPTQRVSPDARFYRKTTTTPQTGRLPL